MEKLSLIHAGARTATFETDRAEPFRGEKSIRVLLNGEEVLETDRNVFTLFDLKPESSYVVELSDQNGRMLSEPLSFMTENESILINVRDYGARGDGEHDDTAFIQAAILSAPEYATVCLPRGTYRTGPLFLKSRMTLLIQRGALLLGLEDRESYPILPGMQEMTEEGSEYNLSSWEGNPLSSFASLINAIDAHDINITGEGILDGNAQSCDWWVDEKNKRGAWRGRIIFLCRCKNVVINGLTVRNSPSWTIHLYYSDELKLLDLTIENPEDAPNTDGVDPESCTRVLMAGLLVSTGDDCVAVKSGKYYMARYHFKRTEDIHIRNCMFKAGHGAVTIGSEASCGVRGVRVEKCVFMGTDRGLRIKTRRGRGKTSFIDDIVFDSVRMEEVPLPVTVNMHYHCDPDGHMAYVRTREALPVDEFTPGIGRISIRNISCSGVGASFLCILGLKESPVGEIEVCDARVSFKKAPPECPIMADDFPKLSGLFIYAENVRRLRAEDITLNGEGSFEPVLKNVDRSELSRIKFE